MATDYDAPRSGAVELAEDTLEDLTARRDDARSAAVDVDETGDWVELPGLDLLDEELGIVVVPMQLDEFRCSRCFLVHHRSQLAGQRSGELICRECN
jgi:hypothetical protein